MCGRRPAGCLRAGSCLAAQAGLAGAARRAICRTACGRAQHASSQARLRGGVPVAPVRGGEVAPGHCLGQRLFVQLRELARRNVGQVAAACSKPVFTTTLAYLTSVPLQWRGACLPPGWTSITDSIPATLSTATADGGPLAGRGAGSPARPGRGAAAAAARSGRAQGRARAQGRRVGRLGGRRAAGGGRAEAALRGQARGRAGQDAQAHESGAAHSAVVQAANTARRPS